MECRHQQACYFNVSPLKDADHAKGEETRGGLSTRVDETLGKAIKELAEEDGRPVSSYLEWLVLRHAIESGKMQDPKKPTKGSGRP